MTCMLSIVQTAAVQVKVKLPPLPSPLCQKLVGRKPWTTKRGVHWEKRIREIGTPDAIAIAEWLKVAVANSRKYDHTRGKLI